MSDKSICANCEHCYIEAFYVQEDPIIKKHLCAEPSRLTPEKIDPISGEKTEIKFPRCEKFNKNGECTKFSNGKPRMSSTRLGDWDWSPSLSEKICTYIQKFLKNPSP